jgi:hypothetical protein
MSEIGILRQLTKGSGQSVQHQDRRWQSGVFRPYFSHDGYGNPVRKPLEGSCARQFLVGYSTSFPSLHPRLEILRLAIPCVSSLHGRPVVLTLLYLKIRRLPPFLLAHWSMDTIALFMTLKL